MGTATAIAQCFGAKKSLQKFGRMLDPKSASSSGLPAEVHDRVSAFLAQAKARRGLDPNAEIHSR